MEGWRQKFRRTHSFDNILKSDRKFAQDILDRFKNENPALMELNPEIGIDQFTIDSDGNPCNYLILHVGHKFIFDYRLIPTHFENIKVNSHLCVNMPDEFPNAYPGMQNEEYHSPERYLLFVERNIKKIRKELISINMSVDEALEALTGDFNKHKKWALQLKNDRMIENKEHIDFFKKLLEKTKDAYYKSDVFKMHGQMNWGYSLTSTSLKKNEKVIAGFNWGVDNRWIEQGNSYGAQIDYPSKNFCSSYDNLGSFKRTINLFYKYFEIIPEIQTNYCFFRSEKENQITAKDLDLCSRLFDELIEYLEPSMLISFSKSLNNYFETTGRLINKDTLEVKAGSKILSVTKGNVKVFNKEITSILIYLIQTTQLQQNQD